MKNLLHKSTRFTKRNASTILTCIGGAGVIATSVTAVKATPKALIILEEAKVEKGEDLTKLEIIKVAGPAYIPSIVIGASTIACIFGANALNKRQQAALMSAYALANNSYKGYKAKVKELYGEDAEEQVRDEIAKDKYTEADAPKDDSKQLFYDEYSGRYFESTIEDVQRAEYYTNRDLVMCDSVTLNDFYGWLKIPTIDGGDEVGWSTGMNLDYYWQTWIDFTHSKFTLDDGTECHKIVMFQEPTPDFTEY